MDYSHGESAMDYYQFENDNGLMEWIMISEIDDDLDDWFEEKIEEANMELQEIANV
tara:strand:- start:93 stop:260 length:168 start_codon:yes stop_codon:yes gene_type:complete